MIFVDYDSMRDHTLTSVLRFGTSPEEVVKRLKDTIFTQLWSAEHFPKVLDEHFPGVWDKSVAYSIIFDCYVALQAIQRHSVDYESNSDAFELSVYFKEVEEKVVKVFGRSVGGDSNVK